MGAPYLGVAEMWALQDVLPLKAETHIWR